LDAVKQHYEGLKTRLRNGEATQGISLAALPTAFESTWQALPRPSAQEFPKTMTTSLRIAPPALSASAQARIEHLSNSLIANLVRHEGYRVRPQDIMHVTGERGPWKTVLEHLLNLGQIERVGDFITFSLVERLRCHLPVVNLETSANRRKT
jgi:DNA-binding transcriptional MocR family regulator